MQTSDEWARNYQQNIGSLQDLIIDHEPSDATHTAAALTGDTVLSPKGSIGKQTRRRSRGASKKAPMTLLNANANNFRALVQQFTGCQSAPPGNYKGPINLDFAQYKYDYSSSSEKPEGLQQRLEHEESDQSLFSFGTNNNIGAVTAATTITTTNDRGHDHELFVSEVDYNSIRPDDPLSLDDFDINSLSIREMSGPGDYSGASRDDFWGY